MADRGPDQARLDSALRDLGSRVAFPATPDLRSGIAARLAQPPAHALRWRPALVGAIVLTLLAATAVAALAFGLAGLRITLTDVLPTAEAQGSSLGARLGLGDRVTLAEADDRSTVGTAWPTLLGEPDEAYLSADGEMVSLVYAVRAGLPALAGSDVGLLVMEIDGVAGPERIEKLVHEADATVTAVSVRGAPGYWIEGRPHVMRFEDRSGDEREVVSRLVGDVLAWEVDGTLYRIETALGLEETLRIAESMSGD